MTPSNSEESIKLILWVVFLLNVLPCLESTYAFLEPDEKRAVLYTLK